MRSPLRRKSRPGIHVHGGGNTQRTWHKQLPVTSLEQTMLDLAASAELKLVRKALGRLDYRYELDTNKLARICALKQAIADYDPRFGLTNSPLEDSWLYYVEHRLVVELDGAGNHHSTAQMHRDHRNDLLLRSHGLRVNR